MKFTSYTKSVEDRHKCSCEEYGNWTFGIYKDLNQNYLCAWCNGVVNRGEAIVRSTENVKRYYEEELEAQVDELSHFVVPERLDNQMIEYNDLTFPLGKEVRDQSEPPQLRPNDGLGKKILLAFLLSALLGGLLSLGDEGTNNPPRDGLSQEWIADNSIEGPTGTFDNQPKR